MTLWNSTAFNFLVRKIITDLEAKLTNPESHVKKLMVTPVTCGGFQKSADQRELLKRLEIPLTLLNCQRYPGQGVRQPNGVIYSVTSPFTKEGSWSPWGLEEPQGNCPTTRKVPRSTAQLRAGHPLAESRQECQGSIRACIIAFFLISEDSESLSLPVYLEELM